VLGQPAFRNCCLQTCKQPSDRAVTRCHLIGLPGSFVSRTRPRFERTAAPHSIRRFGSTAFYPLIRKSRLLIGHIVQSGEASGSLAPCYQCHLADACSLAGTSFYQPRSIRPLAILGTPFYDQSNIYRRHGISSTSRYGR
jgi:hypothetical protein